MTATHQSCSYTKLNFQPICFNLEASFPEDFGRGLPQMPLLRHSYWGSYTRRGFSVVCKFLLLILHLFPLSRFRTYKTQSFFVPDFLDYELTPSSVLIHLTLNQCNDSWGKMEHRRRGIWKGQEEGSLTFTLLQ